MARLLIGAIVLTFVSTLNSSAVLGQPGTFGDALKSKPRNEVEAYRQQKQRELERFNRNSAGFENSINRSMQQLQSTLESQQRQSQQRQYYERGQQYQNPRYQYQQPRNNYDTWSGQRQQTYSAPPIAPKTYSNLPIVIRCPASAAGRVSYSLITANGSAHPYVISPGQKQELRETTDWSIRFENGPSEGPTTYRLQGGKSYEFSSEPNGRWLFYMDRE